MNISLWNIKNAFQKMEKAWWDIAKEKKWQYFFYSESLLSLEKINEELFNKWFLIEYIWKTEDDAEFLLILSKNEVLSPVELNNKNILFNDLALKYSIDYDWWDVENI